MKEISTYKLVYELMQGGSGGEWICDEPFNTKNALEELSRRLACDTSIEAIVDAFLKSNDFGESEKNTIKVVWRIYSAERRALKKLIDK